MFILILDSVEDFHTVEERRLHRIFGGLESPKYTILNVMEFLRFLLDFRRKSAVFKCIQL